MRKLLTTTRISFQIESVYQVVKARNEKRPTLRYIPVKFQGIRDKNQISGRPLRSPNGSTPPDSDTNS